MKRSLGLCTLLALTSCRSFPDDPVAGGPASMDSIEMGELLDCFRCGDVYLGSTPGRREIDIAARRGVELLIDLRSTVHFAKVDVADYARELQLSYVHVPIEPERISDADVDTVLAALRYENEGQVFIFGPTAGHAAMMLAIYRTIDSGVDIEDAIKDARRAGMEPGVGDGIVRRQVERLRKNIAPGFLEPGQPEASAPSSSITSATRSAS